MDYGARWYDPAVARWTSVDPFSEEYAFHSPYSYVLNNPTKLVDPFGLFPVEGNSEISKDFIEKKPISLGIEKRANEAYRTWVRDGRPTTVHPEIEPAYLGNENQVYEISKLIVQLNERVLTNSTVETMLDSNEEIPDNVVIAEELTIEDLFNTDNMDNQWGPGKPSNGLMGGSWAGSNSFHIEDTYGTSIVFDLALVKGTRLAGAPETRVLEGQVSSNGRFRGVIDLKGRGQGGKGKLETILRVNITDRNIYDQWLRATGFK